MSIHHVKIWPVFFADVVYGGKTFEIRYNDRDYRRGDLVIFHEYDPEKKKFTGQKSDPYGIDYITHFPVGLKEGFCAFSLRRIWEEKKK